MLVNFDAMFVWMAVLVSVCLVSFRGCGVRGGWVVVCFDLFTFWWASRDICFVMVLLPVLLV